MVLRGPDIVLYEVVDNVATITLNRPERMNALSLELLDRLDDCWQRFESDNSARVAILTGAGERAFCAGGDLKDFAERGVKHVNEGRAAPPPRYPSATYAWEASKPVIAAVNGYAVAGGFMLALNSDIRIASTTATFGITEALVGRAAPWAMPLIWAVPSSVALEMLMAGTTLDARRALELGFVNRVFEPSELLSAATELATRIAENAPLTVRAHKALFYRGLDVGRSAGYLIADDLCRPVYASEDCQEGQRAFSEHRKPKFQGR